MKLVDIFNETQIFNINQKKDQRKQIFITRVWIKFMNMETVYTSPYARMSLWKPLRSIYPAGRGPGEKQTETRVS